LSQQYDGEIELIIADDNSSDNTEEVVRSIIQKHPKSSCIKYTKHKQNKGMNYNFVWAMQQCNGKFVAICEGDDFWVDSYKIQKQVDFHQKNPKFSFSFHKVSVDNQIKDIDYAYPIPSSDVLTLKDMLFKHYVPTCSVMVVKEFLPNPFPEWYPRSKMGDIPMQIFLLDKGPAKYLHESMAVYRKHDKGITLNKEQIAAGRKAYLYIYHHLNKHFNYKYWHLFFFVMTKVRLGYIKDWLGLNAVLKR
jgi:glycosyltransferase involved in cell wall biosynthesis